MNCHEIVISLFKWIVYCCVIVISESMDVNSLFHLIMIFGLLFASLGGSHAANAGSMLIVENEKALFVSGEHDHIQVKSDQSHCPDENGETGQANHASGCCIASCSAFQVTEPGMSAFNSLPVQISVPWTFNSADGLKPESIYRPPEA